MVAPPQNLNSSAGGTSWDHPRSTIGAAIICEWAEARGLAVDSLLAGSQIDPAQLGDPDALIEAQQEIVVIRNLLRNVGDYVGLGTAIGARHHLTSYGLYGYLLASCTTVREVAEAALQYGILTFRFATISSEVTSDGVLVGTLTADDVPEDIRQFVLERDLAASVQLRREFIGADPAVTPLEIRLRGVPDDEQRAFLVDFYGDTVTFGHAEDQIVNDAGLLDAELPMGNQLTARLVRRECDRQRTERLMNRGVTAEVRALLTERELSVASLDDVAGALHYSPRTLRRRLKQEGTSFREIMDEVRRIRARELLREGRVSRHRIANLVGYSDTSSLMRATRRWDQSD
jgi:AraC-like DNA-binding protein